MAVNNPVLDPAIGTNVTPATAPSKIELIMSSVVGLLTIAAGLWFVVQFILGAIHWIGAGGDKANLQTARSQITQALTGLAIVAVSYVIILAAGYIFGLQIADIAAGLSVLRITR